MDHMAQEQDAASRSRRPRRPPTGTTTGSTSSTRRGTSTSRSRSSARYASSTAASYRAGRGVPSEGSGDALEGGLGGGGVGGELVGGGDEGDDAEVLALADDAELGGPVALVDAVGLGGAGGDRTARREPTDPETRPAQSSCQESSTSWARQADLLSANLATTWTARGEEPAELHVRRAVDSAPMSTSDVRWQGPSTSSESLVSTRRQSDPAVGILSSARRCAAGPALRGSCWPIAASAPAPLGCASSPQEDSALTATTRVVSRTRRRVLGEVSTRRS